MKRKVFSLTLLVLLTFCFCLSAFNYVPTVKADTEYSSTFYPLASYSLGSSSTDYGTALNASSGYITTDYLYLGVTEDSPLIYVDRVVTYFNTSGLPDGANITSVVLTLSGCTFYSSDCLFIFSNTSWPSYPVQASDFSNLNFDDDTFCGESEYNLAGTEQIEFDNSSHVSVTGLTRLMLVTIHDAYQNGVVHGNPTGIDAIASLVVNYTLSGSTNHVISASSDSYCSITPNGNIGVSTGDNCTFTIEAAEGYTIASVYVDSVNVGSVSSYTFYNVAADHTIVAYGTVNTEWDNDFEGGDPLIFFDTVTTWASYDSVSLTTSYYSSSSHSVLCHAIPGHAAYLKGSMASWYLSASINVAFSSFESNAEVYVLKFPLDPGCIMAGVKNIAGVNYWVISDGLTETVSSTVSLSTYTFYNLTLVYNEVAGKATLYVNGVLKYERNLIAPNDYYPSGYPCGPTGNFYFGIVENTYTNTLNVYIDDLHVKNFTPMELFYITISSNHADYVSASPYGVIPIGSGETLSVEIEVYFSTVDYNVWIDGVNNGELSGVIFQSVSSNHTLTIAVTNLPSSSESTETISLYSLAVELFWTSTAKLVYGILVLAGLSLLLAWKIKIPGLIVGLALALLIDILAFDFPVWSLFVVVVLIIFLLFYNRRSA